MSLKTWFGSKSWLKYLAVAVITFSITYSLYTLGHTVVDVNSIWSRPQARNNWCITPRTINCFEFGKQTADIRGLQRWWNSNITTYFQGSSIKPCHSIDVNMASLWPLQDWNGTKKFKGKPIKRRAYINIHDAPRCLNINKMESGLAQIMNKHNFKGVMCHAKNATFSKDNSHHTALASFPGSGNTWTRHLLESISGTLTGAVYNDRKLSKVFKGEGHTERVLVVKSHRAPTNDKRNIYYDNVILLIRTPEESILSIFNYVQTKSHVETIDMTAFNSSKWNRIVSETLKRWKKFCYSYLQEYKGRMMILSYAKLRHDFFNEVFRVSQFLNLTINYKTLWCTYENQEGEFHRKSSDVINKNKVFTDSMLQMIESVKADVEQKITRMFGIDGLL